MEFRSGDHAVHPTHGVGNILRREEKQLAGSASLPYYLLAVGTTIVWVPIAADGSTSLRAVTTKRELEQYRKLLKSRPSTIEREHKQWRFDTNARLTHGTFKVLCEVVRDLTSLGWYRTIGEIDSGMLQKVRNNLRREWAAAAGLSLQDAIQEVDALLIAGRDEFKTA
ncbi:MAG TPA: CarD family transcriptional regulator [Anaerolineae bacterium]|jgi:CarD family transcriptional regulator|nr:CarD family transcriptional regulator [Anaerolineae bacterium]